MQTIDEFPQLITGVAGGLTALSKIPACNVLVNKNIGFFVGGRGTVLNRSLQMLMALCHALHVVHGGKEKTHKLYAHLD